MVELPAHGLREEAPVVHELGLLLHWEAAVVGRGGRVSGLGKAARVRGCGRAVEVVAPGNDCLKKKKSFREFRRSETFLHCV